MDSSSPYSLPTQPNPTQPDRAAQCASNPHHASAKQITRDESLPPARTQSHRSQRSQRTPKSHQCKGRATFVSGRAGERGRRTGTISSVYSETKGVSKEDAQLKNYTRGEGIIAAVPSRGKQPAKTKKRQRNMSDQMTR